MAAPTAQIELWSQELADKLGKPVLVFISGIYEKEVLAVREALLGEDYSDLVMLVHSFGGDAGAGYNLIETIRRHTKQLTIIVPAIAASAATLMCLGANEIMLDEIAFLGPLDMQIGEHEKGVKRQTSALNPFKSLEHLREFAADTSSIFASVLTRMWRFKPDEAIPHANEFAKVIAEPLLSQVEPERIGDFARLLAVTESYATKILQRHTKNGDAKGLAEKLVRGYPSHDYQINLSEAKELGLPVNPIKQEILHITSKFTSALWYKESPALVKLVPPTTTTSSIRVVPPATALAATLGTTTTAPASTTAPAAAPAAAPATPKSHATSP